MFVGLGNYVLYRDANQGVLQEEIDNEENYLKKARVKDVEQPLCAT